MKNSTEKTTALRPFTLAQIETMTKKRATKRRRFFEWAFDHATAFEISGIGATFFGGLIFLCARSAPAETRTIATTMVFCGFGLMSANLGNVLFNFGYSDWDAIGPEQCGAMAAMLQELPDGEAFRQEVLAQGRPFTNGEFGKVRKAHAQLVSEQFALKASENCRDLYAID